MKSLRSHHHSTPGKSDAKTDPPGDKAMDKDPAAHLFRAQVKLHDFVVKVKKSPEIQSLADCRVSCSEP